MNNFVKIINWLYESWFGEQYLLFCMWLENYKLTKVRKNFTNTSPKALIVKKHELLAEGIKKIKRQINTKVQTKEEYEQILKDLEELTPLAIHIEDKKYIESLENIKKVFVFKDKDIKTELDKVSMINRRITDFEALRNNKEWRQRLREKRNKI